MSDKLLTPKEKEFALALAEGFAMIGERIKECKTREDLQSIDEYFSIVLNAIERDYPKMGNQLILGINSEETEKVTFVD